jgi:hypothetical protein
MGMICAILLNLLPKMEESFGSRPFFQLGWGFIRSLPLGEQRGASHSGTKVNLAGEVPKA